MLVQQYAECRLQKVDVFDSSCLGYNYCAYDSFQNSHWMNTNPRTSIIKGFINVSYKRVGAQQKRMCLQWKATNFHANKTVSNLNLNCAVSAICQENSVHVIPAETTCISRQSICHFNGEKRYKIQIPIYVFSVKWDASDNTRRHCRIHKTAKQYM